MLCMSKRFGINSFDVAGRRNITALGINTMSADAPAPNVASTSAGMVLAV